MGQGVEVLGARGACGQGAAGCQLIDAESGLQVVEQEAHFGLGPHPDDAHAQRLIAVGAMDAFQLPGQIRSLEVVQRQRVEDPLVGGGHGLLMAGHPRLIGLRANKHHRPREKEILFYPNG